MAQRRSYDRWEHRNHQDESAQWWTALCQTLWPGSLREGQSLNSLSTHGAVSVKTALTLLEQQWRACSRVWTMGGQAPGKSAVVCCPAASKCSVPGCCKQHHLFVISYVSSLSCFVLFITTVHVSESFLAINHLEDTRFSGRNKFYNVSCVMISVIATESWKMENHKS